MSSGVRKQGGIRNIPRFKEYTKDLIIRYEYDEVMADAPAVKRMKLPVQLDEIAQESYDDATSDFVEWYNQHLIDGTADNLQGIELLAQMARMRHITGLAKIAATLEFCDEFYENTDRSLVIFVHHIDVAYHLVHELKKMFKDKNDVIIDTLSSSKTDMENNNTSSKFNTNGKRWFIIAGTLSCGEGIDGLQKGCDSVLHERQWNPQNEDQATPGRFKRIGQKSKTVNITCVEADETIDADLDIIVERKRKMFHELHNKGMVPKWDEGEIAKELAQKIVERFKKKGKVVKNKNIKQLSKPVKANQFTPINIITDLGI
jgi:sugar-specific transcriptional regulator TrmB